MTDIKTIREGLLSFVFDLQLFAEGTGGDTGAASGEMGENAADAMPQIGQNESSSENDTVKAEKTDDARRAAFIARIKGEDKDLFGEEVDRILKSRMRGMNSVARDFESMRPIIEEAARKYGIAPNDIAGIRAAFDNDDSRFESKAFETGKSIGELKAEERAKKAENELETHRRREFAARRENEWRTQGEALAKKYPGVDFSAELKNPQIMSLLRNNIDLESAYLVVHKDEVIPALMKRAADETEEKLSKKYASNTDRPVENGIGAGGAVSMEKSVSQMSKAEREDIARRVARGERIVL